MVHAAHQIFLAGRGALAIGAYHMTCSDSHEFAASKLAATLNKKVHL